ncbi:MAG: hypothetical protein ABH865_03150 [Candidatus Omnitrophota bacterium]|nr:hypothetical protein [Candidatus Omnitrophota bacterium]
MIRTTRIVSFLFIATLFAGCIPNPFQSQVRALLNETGVPYEFNGCHGGWVAREMHCNVSVRPEQINNFAAKLELQEALPYFDDEKRLIVIPDSQDPSSSFFRNKYRKSFGMQQWVPTKHGFASAIFFYNQKTGKGCLYLSIAYG